MGLIHNEVTKHFSVEEFVKFVWATMGRKILNDHISAKKKISSSNLQIQLIDRTVTMWKCFSDGFQNIARLAFFQSCYSHTCELEFNIFFLGWDMIAQNFSSHSRPCKIL